jgi:hypothetical protein
VSEKVPEITCKEHCFCISFVIPNKKSLELKEFIKSDRLKKSLHKEIAGTKVPIDVVFSWGEQREANRSASKLPPKKRTVSVRFTARDSFDYKRLYGVFPPIQRSFEKFKDYGIRKFDAMVCTRLGFSLKTFKLVGQLHLPADLTLTPELEKRLGKSILSGFNIQFENSPLGLELAVLEFEKEENSLVVQASSSFAAESQKNILTESYEHATEIAKLFVEVRKEE